MIQVGIEEFGEFMKAMGYTKSDDGYTVYWKHPVRLEFSYGVESKTMEFYGKGESSCTVIYSLNLVEQFRQFFKIAA